MNSRDFIGKTTAGAVGFSGPGSFPALPVTGLNPPDLRVANIETVLPADLPGLGLQFKQGLFERDDIVVETIAELK